MSENYCNKDYELKRRKKLFEQRIENIEFLIKFKNITKKEVEEMLEPLKKEEDKLDKALDQCRFKIQVCEEYLSIYKEDK